MNTKEQAKIIDGKAIAQEIRSELKAELEKLDEASSGPNFRKPGLAVILVGEDPASQTYVASKQKACASVGFESFKTELPASTSKEELISVIEKYNNDPLVDGILLQLPLPEGLKAHTGEIINVISPSKDVDGLTLINQGKLLQYRDTVEPCTPKGCMELLKRSNISVEGKKVVVAGRSDLVGKPIAVMLSKANATVTLAHSRTANLEWEVNQADIVIAAIGRKGIIRGEWIKAGAAVIDVGINAFIVEENGKEKKKLYGDVEYEEAKKRAGAITPVPGGVGPMTIAMLLSNTWNLYQKHAA